MWQNVCLLDSDPVNLHFLKKWTRNLFKLKASMQTEPTRVTQIVN